MYLCEGAELRDHVRVKCLVRTGPAPAGEFRENMLPRHAGVDLVEEKCFITFLEKSCNFCVRTFSEIGGGVNQELD